MSVGESAPGGALTDADHARMQQFQEAGFGFERDYRVGSPHLSHLDLRDRLVSTLYEVMKGVQARGMPLSVLEIGAGHGGYTEPALAYGCHVTATEMSRPSVERLQAKFGANDRFRSIFDDDGSLLELGDERFSIIVCAAVLHHIPDYLGFLNSILPTRLAPAGVF